jgi:hypothetical protein
MTEISQGFNRRRWFPAGAPLSEDVTYHMLPPCHHPLVDDFGCIVSPGIDMDAFFDDRI